MYKETSKLDAYEMQALQLLDSLIASSTIIPKEDKVSLQNIILAKHQWLDIYYTY
jgi:hypothetical protein